MTTIGVLGRSWRATVAPDGAVSIDARPALAWHVAADDRWHSPAQSTTVRQRRIAGTPVVETRMRIPNGDAVHRVYAVADSGGLAIVEVENDSPLPIAVAFAGPQVLSARPPTAVPVHGVDLPPSTPVFPVGHRAVIRVALAPDGRPPTALPPVADADQVIAGWLAVCARAGRVVLPDESLVASLTAARCDVLLDGPGDPDDPVAFLIGVGEMARLGTDIAADLPEVAEAVHAIVRREPAWDVEAALDGASHALRAASGQGRAVRDLDRLRATRRAPAPPPVPISPPRGIRVVPWLERMLVADGVLFPGGIPAAWRGHPLEAHGLPAGPGTTVSFAVRWHGERPAVLWETTGAPLVLRSPVSPDWRGDAAQGDALWPPQQETAGV